MSELVSINGTTLISAVDAGKLFKYTPDYITKLARDEKIEGNRIGRQWYVNPESLEVFVAKNEELKKIRNEEIREERKREQVAVVGQKKTEAQKVLLTNFTEHPRNRFIALEQTLIIFVLGLSLGYCGYFLNTQPATTQQASVIEGSLVSLERFAIAFYRLVSFDIEKNDHAITVPSVAHETAVPVTGTTTYTSIVIAPGEVFTEARAAEVRASLSDEVEVSVDPDNPDTGTVVPVFRDRRGEEYRFLITPVTPRNPNSQL